MCNIFKRRKPAAPAPKTAIEDVIILRWHNLTMAEWDALPAIAKTDNREDYYAARGMAS